MLTPISWLKDFVEIKLPVEKLAEELSAAGLTVEKWLKVDTDIVLDPEITPNRPDWLSVYGMAREIAAVTNTKIKSKESRMKTKAAKNFEIKIKNDFELCPRYTAIIIKGVTVKQSPDWMKERLKKVGLRPISNLVDITNYVMWELGNPLHVFDLDKIRGKQMVMEEAKGGEDFRSLDGINYKLPKGAIIFKDVGRVIDLCGLKGGENTAVSSETKNILIHIPVYDSVRIRKTSQALGLRSDASAIFERGADPGNTVRALERAVELVLELAGGKIEDGLVDEKKGPFEPWTVEMRQSALGKVLGIEIEPEKAADILDRLELTTKIEGDKGNEVYRVTVPTFRNDLHIEEDLIEEVGRIYGYDNFPKILPTGPLPIQKVAYFHDDDFDLQIKQILKGEGYSEIYTYSLVSEEQLVKLGFNPEKVLRVDNPLSREYEYLRPHLIGNLLEALKANSALFSQIKLYEFGKIYQGENLDKFAERYQIAGIISGEDFYQVKGELQILLENLDITAEFLPPEENFNPNPWLHPSRTAVIMAGRERIGALAEVHPQLLAKFGLKMHVMEWTLSRDLLEKYADHSRKYRPIPKYPPIIEDLSLILPDKVLVGEVVTVIKNSSKLVAGVEQIDVHENSHTFRITYLDPEKNLTDKEAAEIRSKVLRNLKEKLKVSPKG